MISSTIEIDLPSGESMPAYYASPEGEPKAGIVVLQEIFGLNANMRAIVDDYASRGYAAIAPDLFWRQERGVQLDAASESDRDRATAFMKGLDQPLALTDALAAAAYLRAVNAGLGKVGAVGYCLGGKLAYQLATKQGIDAAASYYGVAIQSVLGQATELQAPLLLHIAMNDHLCPPEAQQAIHAALDGKPDVKLMDYQGVGHAFARRGGGAYDAASAERADKATAAFFETHLVTAG